MPRWLYHCEVETHTGLAGDAERIEVVHPTGRYRVELRDKDVTPGTEIPLLDAYAVFDADDIEAARSVGRTYLREFLETLVFVTGFRLRHHRDVILCDWTRGTTMHEARIFNATPPPNFPARRLDPELMNSCATLLQRERPEAVRRALRWFSFGVSAGPPDEQFEWFWLAVEVLAQFTRDVQPIPDQCPRCRGPLLCEHCGEIPTHRPYPGQAILALMREHSEQAERLFADASAFRNAMMHGESIRTAEEERGKTIADVVDELGRVAWLSLAGFLFPIERDTPGTDVAILGRDSYLNRRIRITGHATFGTPTDREPEITDLPRIEISIIRDRDGERAGGETPL